MIYFQNSESWRRIGVSWSHHRKPRHTNRCPWADPCSVLWTSMCSPWSGCEGLIWTEHPKEVTGQQRSPRAPPVWSAKVFSAKTVGAEFVRSKSILRPVFKALEIKYSTCCLQSLPHTNSLALCLLERKNIILKPFLSNTISWDDWNPTLNACCHLLSHWEISYHCLEAANSCGLPKPTLCFKVSNQHNSKDD